MQTLLDVVSVKVLPAFKLDLVFENGERRRFDMTPYLQKPPFHRLLQAGRFALAAIDYGTVVWPGEIDIAPETLYDRSEPYNE